MKNLITNFKIIGACIFTLSYILLNSSYANDVIKKNINGDYAQSLKYTCKNKTTTANLEIFSAKEISFNEGKWGQILYGKLQGEQVVFETGEDFFAIIPVLMTERGVLKSYIMYRFEKNYLECIRYK
jgi:hypothetical protein